MNVDVKFNTDSDGFISQQCPACKGRFKAQYGAGSDKPLAHCPYCGHHGETWFTNEQQHYIESMLKSEVLLPELKKFGRDLERSMNRSGSSVSFKANRNLHAPRPTAPQEPNDSWPKHTFTCCGETIKHHPSAAPTHCVICGTKNSHE